MTRIRNYLGQNIVIPNRNIAVVGKYIKGAMEGYIDVELTCKEDMPAARKILNKLGRVICRQFDEVFLEIPHVEPKIALATGEFFLRTHVSIWPGQGWVVDQQYVPRIRDLFKREGITIAGDRVLAFYHLRNVEEVPSLRDSLRRSLRRVVGKRRPR